MVALVSWGRVGQWQHELHCLSDRLALAEPLSHGPGICFGMGRSYGDVCLNPGGVAWKTTGLDRFIGFDATSGRLLCEAGVLLRDIQRLFLPRGWILPVTPGTQLITVGGAIANDVHGKNHHRLGSFGDHVHRLTLVRTDGTQLDCGPDLLPGWFAATVGGAGLTGVISTVELQLRPVAGPWLEVETLPYADLHQFFQLADTSETEWEHTVAWIDCLAGQRGRGLFMRGNPIAAASGPVPSGRSVGMPCVPPLSLVNALTLRAFNSSYFHLKKQQTGRRLAHYESFFYPLDNILEWNRMYGPAGFFQYQCVIPRAVGQVAVQALLDEIGRSGAGSFLAVLKTFGQREARGMLSFPRPGVTLALDFPNHGAATQQLFTRLNTIVSEAGGRLYLAKDACMPRELFEAGYPRLPEFLNYRDPGISSALSRRLMGQ